MRVSPGIMTFLVGLVVLAVAGMVYQQSLARNGALGTGGAAAAPAAAGGSAASAPAAATIYTCPMHPQIEQDHPGTCPICGMELVPKHTDTSAVDAQTKQQVAAVKLSPLQAVLSDVQAVHPETRSLDVTVHAIGEVKVPEDQEEQLVSWQAGRIDNLLLNETGGMVTKGQHILDIYSEELVQSEEEYLLALDAVNKLGASGYGSIASGSKRLLDAARSKLLRLGLTAEQLADLESTRQVTDHTPIYATHGGIVMDKYVTEGMYVMEGGKLFTVADLDPIWVMVEVFEKDVANLAVGQQVTMECPIHPGMLFHGRIELIEPSLDSRTRTHQVRVSVANPDYILRPGMIMNADLTVSHGKMLLLPRNAVLHTGDGDLVYVLAGDELWEPRRITVGQDFGDQVQITAGLTAHEAVAGTAVFLLDSEAQLKGIPRPLEKTQAGSDDDAGDHDA